MSTKPKKADETKRRIISAAKKLIRKKGFDATSVREITEAAGCAKGTFYLYFETKTDLLMHLIVEMQKSLTETISKELSSISEDPFRQIDNTLSQICLLMQENDLDLRLLHTGEILGFFMEQKNCVDYLNALTEKVALYIEQGIKKGYFRRLDSQLYGKLIFSMVHNILESAMLQHNPSDLVTVKNEFSIIIRKILEA